PRRRRLRTRRNRGRAPPRLRWERARSARRGRSRPARACSGRRGGSTEGSAHAREEAVVPLLGGEVSRLQRLLELLGQLALLIGEVGGDDHVDDDAQVTGGTAARTGQAVTAQGELDAVLNPRRQLDLTLAL